jgi:hypothetical protein
MADETIHCHLESEQKMSKHRMVKPQKTQQIIPCRRSCSTAHRLWLTGRARDRAVLRHLGSPVGCWRATRAPSPAWRAQPTESTCSRVCLIPQKFRTSRPTNDECMFSPNDAQARMTGRDCMLSGMLSPPKHCLGNSTHIAAQRSMPSSSDNP